ncbi:MAG TPA: GGDEF domain-containing protein [Gallionella sp.]|nr:GGDEF domain-containing protein [Gallionella sp.]
METIELLKQSLVIEPDLQDFTGFALESAHRLGGRRFSTATALLKLVEVLRGIGAATGRPVQVSLLLEGLELCVRWGNGEKRVIAVFEHAPPRSEIDSLYMHLQNSTASADPDILLQRNIEMMRYFDETRARAEKELEELQRTLMLRQREVLEFSHQAETDALTGLFNRRAFDEKLRQAFLHTMRQRAAPLSLMLFDLDYFKQINDEFGHQFGDAYLNKMANVLREIIREDVDFAFRFGGDEFAVILFADHCLACDRAKEVLQLMDNKVSIGISGINRETEDDLTLEEFVRRADSALYDAKHRGRGQAVIDLCVLGGEQAQFPTLDNMVFACG